MSKRLTPAIRAAIIRDYKAGTPNKVIAHKYRISLSYPRELAREVGLPRRREIDHYQGTMTPEKRAAILRDYQDGMKLEVLALKYDIALSTPRQLGKRAGLPPRSIYETHSTYRRMTEGRRKWLQEKAEKADYSGGHYEHNNPGFVQAWNEQQTKSGGQD